MRKNLCYSLLLAVTMMVISACGSRQEKAADGKASLVDSLANETWNAQNDHLLPVIDSLEANGEIKPLYADFLRGLTYDRARHIKVAESYYRKLYESINPEKDGWGFYLEAATRLSQIRMTMSDQKGAIDVATETLERAEKAGQLTDDRKIPFLWSIALCQNALGLEEANQTIQQTYDLIEKQVKDHGMKTSYNQLIFTYIVATNHLNHEEYNEAEKWIRRAEGMLKLFDQPGDTSIVREYKCNLAMLNVYLLQGRKRPDLAYALFKRSLPEITYSPEGMQQAADYLLENEKYAEAADLYDRINAILPDDNKHSDMNLDNINKTIIPRLQANLGANRKDSVVSIARLIADHYDQALQEYRESNAAELATIFDTKGKEMQIAEQKARMSKQRSIAMLIVLVLLCAFFIVYSEYRRRASNKLGAAHVKLLQAYDQLEETTAAKERIESELRIARDIQMSMVPGIFPEYQGLDMYAIMTPAKEVGGDLYGYVAQGDKLYFCLGDVSGKGVPASLFMAQSARLFRTLATEGMMPADIADRMNNELAENNDKGMFVTMFIGLLHLGTGRLDFCNCGHNPPIIDGQFLPVQYDNQPIGLWEDDPFYGETIDDIRGRQLLIYTDGLNEAENQQKELLGNNRLLELMADTANLDSRQVIDMLKAAVEQHRAGADPNDDLTLMCLRLI
jgi:serine phosphatase RsbU (regulator of sigma subunit)